MVVAVLLAEAFLGAILGKTFNEAVDKFLERPVSKIFEDSCQELRDKKMFESVNMKDFLKLCDRAEYPESRRIIENAYRDLEISEQGRGQLFRDFKKIIPGDEESLKVIFEEFLKIFLREVVENCKNTDWKYWVWRQLKEKADHEILLENFEEALQFDIKEAQWFRRSPFWIDFEKDKIYRRKEIDIVKEKLEKENIQIVCGDAASGKSVVVNYIGYEYCKDPKPVYIINLKTDNLDLYKKDIVDLLDNDILLIIEDAHLAFHDVEWIIKKASGRRLKVLISMRPVEEKVIHRETTKFELLMKGEGNFTKIRAFNSAQQIVEFYFSQKYGKEKMKEFMRIIFDIASKYGEDMWLLSFALEAFSLGNGMDMSKIYENIYNNYLKTIAVGKNKFILDVYKYLYPICIFYQYEIPVCKDFLLGNLSLNESISKSTHRVRGNLAEKKNAFSTPFQKS